MSKPVLLVSGFLGAGKTTFINRLLAGSRSRKLGIILNEIGAAGVETSLVRTRNGTLRELAAGCLCCVGPEDLGKGFTSLLAAAPDLEGFVVEASGLSHPGPVIRSLLDQGESWGVDYLGHLCLIPAPDLQNLASRHSLVGFQMNLADRLLLTKTEDLSGEQLASLKTLVGSLAPGIPLLSTSGFPTWDEIYQLFTGQELLSATSARPQPFQEALGSRIHGLDSWLFTSPWPLNPRPLRTVLEAAAPSLIRAKGYLYLAHGGAKKWKYLYQQTGNLRHLGSRPWQNREIRQTALVFYGPSLEVPGLEAALRECEVHE